jgi:hypothetical protein
MHNQHIDSSASISGLTGIAATQTCHVVCQIPPSPYIPVYWSSLQVWQWNASQGAGCPVFWFTHMANYVLELYAALFGDLSRARNPSHCWPEPDTGDSDGPRRLMVGLDIVLLCRFTAQS